MRIAVQMDPIDTMLVERDTSLALMIEAQRRGHEVWWFQADDLWFEAGSIKAFAHKVSVSFEVGAHYRTHEDKSLSLDAFDVVLIRQDPPFDMAYVSNTYLLQRAAEKTLVLNDPRGIRNIPEKLSTLEFPALIAPTFVGRNLDAIVDFASRFEHVVLKPAFLAGGDGVIKLTPSADDFAHRVRDFLRAVPREPIIVQDFIPAVMAGDKRIFVLDGEAVGVVRRMPTGGDFRANLHVGGQAQRAHLDERDLEISAAVRALLDREGILFAGLDVIDGRLTEINVTSPTLVRELMAFSDVDLPNLFWNAAERKCAARARP